MCGDGRIRCGSGKKGLAAFIYTAFKFPGVMNNLNQYARLFVKQIFDLGVDDKYTVWLNIVSYPFNSFRSKDDLN